MYFEPLKITETFNGANNFILLIHTANSPIPQCTDKYTIGFSLSQTTGKAREMITDIKKNGFYVITNKLLTF